MSEETTTERLARKAVRDPATGCLIWRGTVTPKGYGRVCVAGRQRYAHRVAYELAVQPIADGLVLDHLCRNRACIEPTHLEPVTNRENLARGTALNAASIAAFPDGRCGRGHALGPRRDECLTCRAETDRVRRVTKRPPHPLADCPWCSRRIAYYPIALTFHSHGKGCPGSLAAVRTEVLGGGT